MSFFKLSIENIVSHESIALPKEEKDPGPYFDYARLKIFKNLNCLLN